jgi:hypothetical protein
MTDKIHECTLKLLDELKAIRAQSSSPSDAMAAMKVPLDALLEMYPDVHAAVHGKPAVEAKADAKADKPADKPAAAAPAAAPAKPPGPAAGAFHFSGEATPDKPPA